MEGPLWTTRHAPALADLPQDDAREHFERAVPEPMNLLVHGPPGVGKTAAVRALARETHANPDADLIEINVADVFAMTKKELSEDPRFSSFVDAKRRRTSSKADLLNHVIKESAAYSPVSGAYKTILLDNAEGMREDFQQALRRVMERHHEATQFVVATRQPSAVIPPIRSRTFPVVMPAPTHAETVDVVRSIVEAEEVPYDEEGLEYVAGYADGDLRGAILGAQTTAEGAGEITMDAAYEALEAVESDERITAMVDAADTGEFQDARSTLDELLIDDGHDAADVLGDVLREVRSRHGGARAAQVHRVAGEVDAALAEGTSDRVHLARLLAELNERS
jgi:replication factor C small subunit